MSDGGSQGSVERAGSHQRHIGPEGVKMAHEETFCEMMRRHVMELQKSIRRFEDRISELERAIHNLEAQPNSKLKEIEALKQLLKLKREQLEAELLSLSTTEMTGILLEPRGLTSRYASHISSFVRRAKWNLRYRQSLSRWSPTPYHPHEHFKEQILGAEGARGASIIWCTRFRAFLLIRHIRISPCVYVLLVQTRRER
jgi:hypothetical protein